MATLCHPADLGLADDVLREQDPDPQRILLWLRGDRDAGRQDWQRISGHLLARSTVGEHVHVVPVRVAGFRQDFRTEFRRLFDRFWSRQRQAGGQYILPTGDWVEAHGPSRGDVLLAWSEDPGAALDTGRAAELWPAHQGCRQLGPNLVLVLGIEPPAPPPRPTTLPDAKQAPPVGNGVVPPTPSGRLPDAELQRRLEARSRHVRELSRSSLNEQALQEARELRDWVGEQRGQDHPWFATCLLLIAYLHQHRGEAAEAEPLYRQALAINCPILGDNHPNFSTGLNNLALLYQAQGNHADAEPLLRQAVQIRRTALQEMHPLVAASLNNLGLVCHARGDTTAAEPLLVRAVDIFRATLGETHPDLATCLENVAAFYESLGDAATANLLASQARQVRHAAEGKEHVLLADTLNFLAVLRAPSATTLEAALAGTVEDVDPVPWLATAPAAESYWEDEPAAETSTPPAELEPSVATSSAETGNLPEPVSSSTVSEGEPVTGALPDGNAQVSTEGVAGEPIIAREPVAEIAPTTEEIPSPGTEASEPHKSASLVIEDLTALDEEDAPLSRQAPDAVSLPSDAGLLIDEAESSAVVPVTEMVAVCTEERVAQPTGAEESLATEEALPERATWDVPLEALADIPGLESPPSSADLLTDESAIDMEVTVPDASDSTPPPPPQQPPAVAVEPPPSLPSDAPTEVESSLSAPTAVEPPPPVENPVLIVLDGPAHTLLPRAENEIPAASLLIPPVQPLPEPVPEEEPPTAEELEARAEAAWAAGNATTSERLYQQALDLRAAAVGAEHPDCAVALRGMARSSAATGRVAEAVASLRRMVGLEPAAPGLHRDPTNVDLFLSLVWQQLPGVPAAVDAALDLVLRHRATRFAGEEPEAGPREVARSLPAGSGLVEFVQFCPCDLAAAAVGEPSRQLPARYLAFTLPAGDGDGATLIDLGEAALVDRSIAEFRTWILGELPDNGTEPRWRSPATQTTVPAAGSTLRQTILDPIAVALAGRSRLFLAPAGNLACLPFDVLLAADGRPFLETHDISYLDSGLDVLFHGTSPEEQPGPCVVAADPDFDLFLAASLPSGSATCRLAPGTDFAPPRFDRLTATRRAGKHFAALLGAEPWLAGSVRKGRLQGIHSPRILHLATHAVLGTDVPAGAALALAGANGCVPGRRPPADDDGLLTAAEVAQLDLAATELVVLPACDTGSGPGPVGEHVLGLRRAFLQAGSAAVVLSLWKVTDWHVKELLSDYYARLLGGEPRSVALRQARLALRTRFPDHPEYWGAFVCHGDPGPLRPLPGAHKKGKAGGLVGALRWGR
jgi:CHAT domain-containing protein/tetratricopeptide (TPR) repeat protein